MNDVLQGEFNAARDVVQNLMTEMGLPYRLRDVGVGREELEGIAEATLADPAIRANPRPITCRDQLVELLERAW